MFTPQGGTKLLLPTNQVSLNGCKAQGIHRCTIRIGLSSLESHQLYMIWISQSLNDNTLQEVICNSGHLGFQHFNPIKEGCRSFCFSLGQFTYLPHHLSTMFAVFGNHFHFQVSIGVDIRHYTSKITGDRCITTLDQQITHNRHIQLSHVLPSCQCHGRPKSLQPLRQTNQFLSNPSCASTIPSYQLLGSVNYRCNGPTPAGFRPSLSSSGHGIH